MKKKLLVSFRFVSLFILLASLTVPTPALGGGTVGNGTPGSCTEAAFNSALTGGGVVTFNCGEDPFSLTLSNQKTIAANTTIHGGSLITLHGGGSTRLFTVNAGSTLTLINVALMGGSASQGGVIYNHGHVTLTNVTLTGNQAPGGSGGCIYNASDGSLTITGGSIADNTASAGLGGAIANEGTLTILNGALTNNFGGMAGGSIINSGTATITSSTFSMNSGGIGGAISNSGSLTIEGSIFYTNYTISSHGGAIYNSGSLEISTSTFSGNYVYTGKNGGGVFNDGTAVIESSYFLNNAAPGSRGGGIYNNGRLTILADTFKSNTASAGLGGGISSDTTYPMTITNSTFFDNFAGYGGGGLIVSGPVSVLNSTFYNNTYGSLVKNTGNGTITIRNTLLSSSTMDSCSWSITSLGHNLENAATCNMTQAGDLPNSNPKLGPFADNGGPTQTFALLPGSPAINAGTNAGCPATDQRGVARPQFGTCDIGAYEFVLDVFLPALRR